MSIEARVNTFEHLFPMEAGETLVCCFFRIRFCVVGQSKDIEWGAQREEVVGKRLLSHAVCRTQKRPPAIGIGEHIASVFV